MQRHLPLMLILAFTLLVTSSHHWVSQYYMTNSGIDSTNKRDNKPDFSAIPAGKQRKQAFFKFLQPYVEATNKDVLNLRQRVLAGKISDGEMTKLAKKYRIKSQDPKVIMEQLKIKVDTIPASLVLSQAAIESAWGTSRFAKQGNNYFGQWCFKAGCGLVPNQRVKGKNHEVRIFKSTYHSVDSYIRNLNSHPAYKELRQIRAQTRRQNLSSSGCELATGLLGYSEKGQHYVESIKLMIRANELEPDPQQHCAPVMIAEDSAQPQTNSADKPKQQAGEEDKTEIATDDHQQDLDPSPKKPIPST